MRVSDVAKVLNVSPSSVRYYCDKGWLECSKTPGGQRFFTQENVQKFKETMGVAPDSQPTPHLAFYVRSSSGDKKLIQAQIDELTQAYGEPDKIFRDSASGLNEHRPGLQRLLNDVRKGKYTAVCATYQDRLTRFGFSYIKQLVEQNGVSVLILHDKQKYSIEQELMDDFMSLIASFSGRFYRLRGYNQQRELLASAKDEIDKRESQRR